MNLSAKRIGLLLLAFFLGTPVLLWLTYQFQTQRAMDALIQRGQQDLVLYVQNLDSKLAAHDHMVTIVALADSVRRVLTYPDLPGSIEAANRFLEDVQQQIHASAVYVMATDGKVLAASNWGLQKSFVGHNYSFRDYFQGAVEGRTSSTVAVGVTSGVIGYYVAHPVSEGNEIIGVLVIKVGLEDMQLLFSDPEVKFLVADANQVVLLASEQAWRYKTLKPLGENRREQLLRERRYADSKLDVLQMTHDRAWNRSVSIVSFAPSADRRIDNIGVSGRSYLGQTAILLSRGWEIRVFNDLDQVTVKVQISMLLAALICISLLFAGLYFVQRVELLKRLRQAAMHDSLTGLYTRRYMEDSVTAQLSRMSRGQLDGLAAAMVDIDHFKQVNDTYGHKAGDVVLAAVAHEISQSVRKGDVAVRYGGEEFVIILSTSAGRDALAVIERTRGRIADLRFNQAVRNLRITVSAGVVHYRSGESLDSMLDRADQLLYEAKRAGRDRVFSDRFPASATPVPDVEPDPGSTTGVES